jgi:hypothetical protein
MTNKIFKEFPPIESTVMDNLEQIGKLLQPDNYEGAKDLLDKLITAVRDYKREVERGKVRNLDYADLLMVHLHAFISPVIIKSNDDINNGTCFFVELEDKCIAVTNYHVVQHWLDLRSNGVLADFRISNYVYPMMDQCLIDSCETLDLATILIPNHIKLMMVQEGKLFFKYKDPLNVEVGDMVFALGWPGVLREDQINSSNLYVTTIHDEVISVSDRRFIIEFHRENWLKRMCEKEITDLTSLGGLSGGPVFLFSDGILHIVGVIFENVSAFVDGVQCVHFKHIRADGTIEKP